MERNWFCSLDFLLQFNMYSTYLNAFNIKYNLQMANNFIRYFPRQLQRASN